MKDNNNVPFIPAIYKFNNIINMMETIYLGEEVNILSGGRFKTKEETLNPYTMKMFLTIEAK